MTLAEVNQKLIELLKKISEAIDSLKEKDIVYEMRFYDLLLKSGYGNAQAREAEAKKICDNEGLYIPMLDAKSELRKLINEKECIIEIGKNLRVLDGKDYGI